MRAKAALACGEQMVRLMLGIGPSISCGRGRHMPNPKTRFRVRDGPRLAQT